MKKIDKLVLNSFISPFLLTFLVVVFILLNLQMLKYFDDLIGKGLGWGVIGQLLFYFAVFTTPTAMPLAVLLSSLITFGNLGEHFELTAIKSAGISLIRTLRPIFLFVLLLTALAFYVNNNLVPKAALEAYSLLYDIKQKKPALELRAGSFYVGIPDISIKINKKFPEDEVALKGVVIYDHRKNEGNKEVTIADSGRMYTILNDQYLKLELFNGYNYVEGSGGGMDIAGKNTGNGKNVESLRRDKFGRTQVVFDLSSFELSRTDKKWFQGNRIMRNISQLNYDIDSIRNEVLSQRLGYYLNKPNYFTYYGRNDSLILPVEIVKFKKKKDSLDQAFFLRESALNSDSMSNPKTPSPQPAPVAATVKPKDTSASHKTKLQQRIAFMREHTLSRNNTKKVVVLPEQDVKKNTLNPTSAIPSNPVLALRKTHIRDSIITHKIDSLIKQEPTREIFQGAASSARQVKSQLMNSNSTINNYSTDMRTFQIQWHKIIANSLACIAMFLIGAPLGSIIKKGGLGIPFLVSIIFFIIFYVMNMIGEKWAKRGFVDVAMGIWASDMILLLVGVIFLRQARIDARLFDADSYLVAFDKFKLWLKKVKKAPISRTSL